MSGVFWNTLSKNLFQEFIASICKTSLTPRQLLHSVHMEKSYLGNAGYPVLERLRNENEDKMKTHD